MMETDKSRWLSSNWWERWSRLAIRSVEEIHAISLRALYPFISVRTWFIFERSLVLIIDLEHDLADFLWCFSLPRCRGVFHDQICIYSANR